MGLLLMMMRMRMRAKSISESEMEEEKPKKKTIAKKKLTNKMNISIPTNVFDKETDLNLDFIDELQEEEYV